MFRKNDLILILVIFGSIGTALCFPGFGNLFLPYPLYLMMLILFFSFLNIDFARALRHIKETSFLLFNLCLLKLVLIPTGLFYLTRAIWPEYGLPVLLLSGISTGVLGPFISVLLNANTFLVLMVVVLTSLIAPFSLPALVNILMGQTLEISFWAMFKTLSMVVFIHALGVILLRRRMTSVLEKLTKVQFPVSVVMIACINLGVFAKYSSFLITNPAEIAKTLVLAFILSALYHLSGFLVTWGMKKEDRMAAAISFAYMNNVLVVVFSSQFFGPLAPTLAAFYMLPFFVMIVPARMAGGLFK